MKNSSQKYENLVENQQKVELSQRNSEKLSPNLPELVLRKSVADEKSLTASAEQNKKRPENEPSNSNLILKTNCNSGNNFDTTSSIFFNQNEKLCSNFLEPKKSEQYAKVEFRDSGLNSYSNSNSDSDKIIL